MVIKRVLVIHSTTDSLKDLVAGLQAGLEKQGARVDIEEVKNRTRPLNWAPYDLVLVGSPALGFFGGKIDNELKGFLRQCKRTSAQKTIAFVNSKLFGASKAVKTLMDQLEKQGAFVQDFRVLKDYAEAKSYTLGLKI
ncbi:hypothetical protein JCM16358_13980 [Halanaerocella petrolearia]